MTRTLVAFAAAMVLLSGCGSTDQPNQKSAAGAQESTTPSASPAGSPTGTPSLPADEPPVTSTYSIAVPGLATPLLVTRQVHPRGGFQLRVFAPDGSTWTELRVDGNALLPFIATDVLEHPLSVDCTDGGLVVTEAVSHTPAGVAFAWDVKQTTYAVDGSQVTAGATRKVADNVLPKQLEAKYPDLVRHTAFKTCRVA